MIGTEVAETNATATSTEEETYVEPAEGGGGDEVPMPLETSETGSPPCTTYEEDVSQLSSTHYTLLIC